MKQKVHKTTLGGEDREANHSSRCTNGTHHTSQLCTTYACMDANVTCTPAQALYLTGLHTRHTKRTVAIRFLCCVGEGVGVLGGWVGVCAGVRVCVCVRMCALFAGAAYAHVHHFVCMCTDACALRVWGVCVYHSRLQQSTLRSAGATNQRSHYCGTQRIGLEARRAIVPGA